MKNTWKKTLAAALYIAGVMMICGCGNAMPGEASVIKNGSAPEIITAGDNGESKELVFHKAYYEKLDPEGNIIYWGGNSSFGHNCGPCECYYHYLDDGSVVEEHYGEFYRKTINNGTDLLYYEEDGSVSLEVIFDSNGRPLYTADGEGLPMGNTPTYYYDYNEEGSLKSVLRNYSYEQKPYDPNDVPDWEQADILNKFEYSEYDPEGNVVYEEKRDGSEIEVWTYKYDGEILHEANKSIDGVMAEKWEYDYTEDSCSKMVTDCVTSVRYMECNETKKYDESGLPVFEETQEFDSAGELIRYRRIQWEYDTEGRLIREDTYEKQKSFEAREWTIFYEYSPDGRLIKEDDGYRVTKYMYVDTHNEDGSVGRIATVFFYE